MDRPSTTCSTDPTTDPKGDDQGCQAEPAQPAALARRRLPHPQPHLDRKGHGGGPEGQRPRQADDGAKPASQGGGSLAAPWSQRWKVRAPVGTKAVHPICHCHTSAQLRIARQQAGPTQHAPGHKAGEKGDEHDKHGAEPEAHEQALREGRKWVAGRRGRLGGRHFRPSIAARTAGHHRQRARRRHQRTLFQPGLRLHRTILSSRKSRVGCRQIW